MNDEAEKARLMKEARDTLDRKARELMSEGKQRDYVAAINAARELNPGLVEQEKTGVKHY